MTINEKTRISELISANPLVIDRLAELNPHFSKLRNPILRKLLARRVSVSEACAIAGCKLGDFLDKMMSIGFETEEPSDSVPVINDDHMTAEIFTAGLQAVELDVRPLLAKGDDPLKIILKTSKALNKNECLKVINTFEPKPLINLLCGPGFKSWTERPEENIVYTWFIRNEDGRTLPRVTEQDHGLFNTTVEFKRMVESFSPGKMHTVDVRPLEMPLPMICILENLSTLKEDEALFVYHKKIPGHLLPELKERGFRYYIEDVMEGRVNMLICKV